MRPIPPPALGIFASIDAPVLSSNPRSKCAYPLARLVGLTAAASLMVAPLVIVGPADAAADGLGTATISIVDDLGAPVKGLVVLVPVDDSLDTYPMEPEAPVPPAAPVLQSSYTADDVPVGDYAVTVIGGWPLITCVGITPCGLDGLGLGLADPADRDQGDHRRGRGRRPSYKVKTATPKLVGTPRVGQTLEVTSAMDFGEELGDLVGEFIAPKVVWKRSGVKIAGAKGTEYTLGRRDVGKAVSATISYPGILKLLTGLMAGGADLAPAPITKTTAAVTKNGSATDLKVSGGTAYVRVSGPVDEVSGWVQLSITGQRAIWARVQDGFAPINLPTLKPGTYKVTATFQGNGELNASSDSATLKVKGKKPKKGKKGKGKKH